MISRLRPSLVLLAAVWIGCSRDRQVDGDVLAKILPPQPGAVQNLTGRGAPSTPWTVRMIVKSDSGKEYELEMAPDAEYVGDARSALREGGLDFNQPVSRGRFRVSGRVVDTTMTVHRIERLGASGSTRLGASDVAQRKKAAMAMLRQGDPSGALGLFREIVVAAPDDAEARAYLGMLLSQTGDDEGAVRELHTALRTDSTNARAHGALGNILRRQGKAREAVEHLRSAVAAEPTDGSARNNLGLALLAAGEPGEAVGAFEEALSLDPDSPVSRVARCNLGEALVATGDRDRATSELERCLEGPVPNERVRQRAQGLLSDLGRGHDDDGRRSSD